MTRKYTRISIDIDFDDIADDISSKDLISELNSRSLDMEEQEQIKEFVFNKCNCGEFENLKFSTMEQEMKMRHFLEVMDKYSLENIEYYLKK